MILFKTTAVKTSNPTNFIIFHPVRLWPGNVKSREVLYLGLILKNTGKTFTFSIKEKTVHNEGMEDIQNLGKLSLVTAMNFFYFKLV
jgi:hypothetical protein